jgi:hypothetical protein
LATDGELAPDVFGNDNVTWIVKFEAYPKPQIIWSRGKDEAVIKKNPIKYKIKTETRQTALEISNVELADSGLYRLVISNGNETHQHQTRDFHLLVRGEPIGKKIINLIPYNSVEVVLPRGSFK